MSDFHSRAVADLRASARRLNRQVEQNLAERAGLLGEISTLDSQTADLELRLDDLRRLLRMIDGSACVCGCTTGECVCVGNCKCDNCPLCDPAPPILEAAP